MNLLSFFMTMAIVCFLPVGIWSACFIEKPWSLFNYDYRNLKFARLGVNGALFLASGVLGMTFGHASTNGLLLGTIPYFALCVAACVLGVILIYKADNLNRDMIKIINNMHNELTDTENENSKEKTEEV